MTAPQWEKGEEEGEEEEEGGKRREERGEERGEEGVMEMGRLRPGEGFGKHV